MVMDIMVAVIFFGTVFLSMHRGFALTVVNFLRSIAGLVLAVFFSDDLRDWLLAHTGMADWMEERLSQSLQETLTSTWEASSLYQMLPELLKGQAVGLTDTLSGEGASRLVSVFMGIVSFFIIVIAVGVVASVLNRLFSRQYNGGFFGFIDWLLGGAMGLVTGAIYVFVFLAVITPATALFMPDLSQSLAASLADSRFAGSLYDNNLLLLFFRDFLK
jgi:hypothetical protein